MITEDGRLAYRVELDPRRGFRHRLRLIVNPVIGIGCGLLLGAALFLLGVQALFGVRPSIVAIVVAVAAVIGYAVGVLHARTVSRRHARYDVVLEQKGILLTGGSSSGGHPWSRFTRWLEDDADFILASGGVRDRLLVVIPKDGVPEEEQDLLREVLHSQIDPDDEPIDQAFVEMDWDEEPARRAAD